MIVTVSLMGMMQMALDEIVGMVAVRNCLMSASGGVVVFVVMRAAGMAGAAARGIGTALRQRMLIHMAFVKMVQMAVVQIVDVPFMLHRGMSTARAVRMGMLIVSVVIAHLDGLLTDAFAR